MKILLISKYPPIEGGVSSGNYWLAKALGERGAEVAVLTNALAAEKEWRAELDCTDIATLKKHQPKNVFFYSLQEKPPFHIPYSEAYLSRLINLGLKIIGERGADIIYAHYLEPYAAAGFILKKITGIPLVIKHSGSDIYRLFKDADFRYFLGEVIAGADMLIFSRSLIGLADALNFSKRRFVLPPHRAIDSSVFTPDGEHFDFAKYGAGKTLTGIPILTYLGKASLHKGIAETIEALSGIKEDFRFVFVSGGRSLNEFVSHAKNKLADKFIHIGFIPPWEVPALMRSSRAVLHLENEFPVPTHSPLQSYEAILCGTPLVVSREIFEKIAPHFSDATKKNFTVVDDPKEIAALRSALKGVILLERDLQKNAAQIREELLLQNDWGKFVDFHLSLFQSLAWRRRRFLSGFRLL